MSIRPYVILACAAAPLAAEAAPPNQATPVTALFRCPTTEECVEADAIAGDAAGAIAGTVGGVQGAYLTADGTFYARLDLVSGRTLALDFRAADGPAPCLQATTGCRRTFDVVASPQTHTQIGAVTPQDVELPGHWYDIPVGGWSYARLKLNFADPDGRDYLWTIRFFPTGYAGTTHVKVTRLATNVWEAEATAADRARLVSTTTRGRTVMTDEGLFAMPFKIRVVR